MTTRDRTAVLDVPIEPFVPDEAELAAVAFLARYSGRTLDAYRHDLRNLFQWAADNGLPVLEATRAHLELYRSSMEDRGWLPQPSIGASPPPAASTASPTSMDASRPTPPSTCVVPPSTRPSGEGWTAASSEGSSSPPSGSTTFTPPSLCCSG